MALSDIIAITILTALASVQQVGFGVPLIVSHSATWTERIRYYTSITGVGGDFGNTTPEYLAAQAMFLQSPAPAQIAIGRAANVPVQLFSIAAVAAVSGTYSLRIGALTATFVMGISPTNDAIIAGIATAIAALNSGTGVAGLTVTQPGSSGSKTLLLTASSGTFFDVQDMSISGLLTIAQTTTDPGIAADLAAILNADNSGWYSLITLFNSSAIVHAVATWCEANKRLYIARTGDSAVINTALSGGTDIASVLTGLEYDYTALIYHPASGAFLDASWAGLVLPLNAGSETWAFKSPKGIAPYPLTATQVTNLTAKSCNYVGSFAGLALTMTGATVSGQFIDVTRFIDWFTYNLQARVLTILANNSKIPYTDGGGAVIEAAIRAQIKDGIDVGGIAASPAPVVNVPLVATQNPTDRLNRILRGTTFSFNLAGAIHKAIVQGSIS